MTIELIYLLTIILFIVVEATAVIGMYYMFKNFNTKKSSSYDIVMVAIAYIIMVVMTLAVITVVTHLSIIWFGMIFP